MSCPPCNHLCRQGRDCEQSRMATRRVLGLFQKDGGHRYDGGVSFPIEPESTEADDKPVTTPEQAGSCARLWFFIAAAAILAAAAITFAR